MATERERPEPTNSRLESESAQPAENKPTGEGASTSDAAMMQKESPPSGASGNAPETQPQLIAEETAHDMRSRWDATQGAFVDDPRNAVNDADRLVSDLLQLLSKTFEEQHHELENQWKKGQPSTEDLRTALNRYRSFFNRLLKV